MPGKTSREKSRVRIVTIELAGDRLLAPIALPGISGSTDATETAPKLLSGVIGKESQ